jgi:nitroimidazol reductase NimA-like FMN-containing flavoprotein (pyridoxamine 5'-phosphate oxidase superfamily)
MEALPYGVPLSFCFINGYIYFHCAIEGRKIENLENNEVVSFCAVGKTEVMPSKFGIKYESVIVAGEAFEAFDDEKQMALEGLLQKYSPEHIEDGAKYIDALWNKTRVFGITADHISGKSRK